MKTVLLLTVLIVGFSAFADECPHKVYSVGVAAADFQGGKAPRLAELLGQWVATGFATPERPRYSCDGLGGSQGSEFWDLLFSESSGGLVMGHRIEGVNLAEVPVDLGAGAAAFDHKSSWGQVFKMQCRLISAWSGFLVCSHTDEEGGSLAYLEFKKL